MVCYRSFSIKVLLFFTLCYFGVSEDSSSVTKCDDLLDGQYQCDEPVIDSKTQSAAGCNENHTVKVECRLSTGLKCETNGKQVSNFQRDVPCRYTNGYSYKTALLLSIFLGMFGIDRFYLGYPAIAAKNPLAIRMLEFAEMEYHSLLKFCTLGFFFLFQLIDILLIATQVVGPADESEYVIDYYGPRLIKVGYDNNTFLKPQ